jgi:hypothetical protein
VVIGNSIGDCMIPAEAKGLGLGLDVVAWRLIIDSEKYR